MAYADENSSRKNLTVTSLCFIVYYIAGGKFLESKVTLLVINMQFTRPVFLAVFVWGVLFWFALRYWQDHRRKIRETFNNELDHTRDFVHSKRAIGYVEKETGKKFQRYGGFVPDKIVRNGRFLCIRIGDVHNGTLENDGLVSGSQSIHYNLINFSGVRGFILKIYLYVYLAFTKPGFGDYFVPYILFFVAVLMGTCFSLLPCLVDFISHFVTPAKAGV